MLKKTVDQLAKLLHWIRPKRVPLPVYALSKDEAQKLQQDYIPDGTLVDIRWQRFRKCKEFEILRCGVWSTSDPQSGPIYCGRVADWVCWTRGDNEFIALCSRHHDKVLDRLCLRGKTGHVTQNVPCSTTN